VFRVSKKKASKQNRDERREELLRPSRYLGYDRDNLGMYLLSRGAYKIAESQFRRAVWLNPFECRFMCHLAWCLYKQQRYEEAKVCVGEIDAEYANIDEQTQMIIERIKHRA
jgi:tetratricopeptide (TPR) repeat protein